MGLFKDIFSRSTTISGTPSIQPTPVHFAGTNYTFGFIVREPHLQHGTTDAIMQTSIAGFSIPNPVVINGLPTNPTVIGTTSTRTSDAPKKGGCK